MRYIIIICLIIFFTKCAQTESTNNRHNDIADKELEDIFKHAYGENISDINEIAKADKKLKQELEKYIVEYPKSKKLWYVYLTIGNIETNAENYDAAIKNYSKILEISRSPEEYILGATSVAMSYIESDRVLEALKLLEDLESRYSEEDSHFTIMQTKAIACITQEKYEEAISVYRKMYNSSKGDDHEKAELYRNIIYTYDMAGKTDLAMKEIERYKNIFKDFTRSANSLTRFVNLKTGESAYSFNELSIDGKTITLNNYRGKVVLIYFWATWCFPCMEKSRKILNIYNKRNKDGLEIIGISLDKKKQDVQDFVEKNAIKWLQYCDEKKWDNSVAQKYGIRDIPQFILLDRDGKVRNKYFKNDKDLNEAIEIILKE